MAINESQTRLPHMWRKWEDSGSVDLRLHEAKMLLPFVHEFDQMTVERMGNQEFRTFTASIRDFTQTQSYQDTRVQFENWNSGPTPFKSASIDQEGIGWISWGEIFRKTGLYPDHPIGGHTYARRDLGHNKHEITEGLKAADTIRDMIDVLIPKPIIKPEDAEIPDLENIDFENPHDLSVLNLIQTVQNRIFLAFGGHKFAKINGYLNLDTHVEIDETRSYHQGFPSELVVDYDPYFQSDTPGRLVIPGMNPYHNFDLPDRIYPDLYFTQGRKSDKAFSSIRDGDMGPEEVLEIFEFLDKVLPLHKPEQPTLQDLTS